MSEPITKSVDNSSKLVVRAETPAVQPELRASGTREEMFWKREIEAHKRLGLCLGALKGLLHQVPNEIRIKISDVIAEAEQPISPTLQEALSQVPEPAESSSAERAADLGEQPYVHFHKPQFPSPAPSTTKGEQMRRVKRKWTRRKWAQCDDCGDFYGRTPLRCKCGCAFFKTKWVDEPEQKAGRKYTLPMSMEHEIRPENSKGLRPETLPAPSESSAEAAKDEVDRGNISDGFHTFNELYDHRCTLFLALMKCLPRWAWISTLHDDGSSFEGWFIAGLCLPTGDATYHLPSGMWSLACETKAKILERAPKWDGHTASDVVRRIQAWTISEVPTGLKSSDASSLNPKGRFMTKTPPANTELAPIRTWDDAIPLTWEDLKKQAPVIIFRIDRKTLKEVREVICW